MKNTIKTISKTKKTRGFMCQSTAATAVCMPNDPRSVILPRNINKSDRILFDDHRATSINNVKYSRLRLIDSPTPAYMFVSSNRNSLKTQVKDILHHQEPNPKPLSVTSSSSSSDHVFQVVVMRVSLHCQGCAGKLKKHLSKMEGVTSYSIDLETKRVTVMGHVSPDGVLESISKVKKAEFWPTC